MLNKTQKNSIAATVRIFQAQEKKLVNMRNDLSDKTDRLESKLEDLQDDQAHTETCNKCGHRTRNHETTAEMQKVDEELMDAEGNLECVEIAVDCLETALKELEDLA